jgi:predicted dehydrogenase
VAYYRRCLPRFLEVRRILAEDGIGRITGIRYAGSADKLSDKTAWRVDSAVAGGGHFLDVGSHVLDLLDFLFGPLRAVTGNAANLAGASAVEDSVAVSFVTEAGIPGVASWNFAAAVPEDRLSIAGTKGQISFSVFGSEPVVWVTPSGSQQIDRPHPPHVAQPLIQTVVDDLLGRGACPSTGVSARRTSLVMDCVLDRYYGGRTDAFWERPETWPGRRL